MIERGLPRKRIPVEVAFTFCPLNVPAVKGNVPLSASVPHERTPAVLDFTSQLAALSKDTVKDEDEACWVA